MYIYIYEYYKIKKNIYDMKVAKFLSNKIKD